MPFPDLQSRPALAIALLGLMALAGPVGAQHQAQPPASDGSSLPTWERLTPEQRELLITPLRERWNSEPDARARMLGHAQRWRDMTPEERSKARSGMKRWRHMSPDQREQMRALYSRMRALPPEQRAAFKAQWRAMTPEQRREWVESNPPPDERPRR